MKMENQMSGIDPSGTTPGLAPKTEVQPELLNMKCRNPNKACDSMSATQIKTEMAEHVGHRVYRCVECGWVVTLAVGGHIAI